MGIFQQFPYSNFHEMNLDSILSKIKELEISFTDLYNEWLTWKREQFLNTNVIVTPEDFGAKGDGVTDDTEAIKKAFEYPFVYLNSAEYRITDSIDTYSNIIISHGSKILCDMDSWKPYALNMRGDNSIYINGLYINGFRKAALAVNIDNDVNNNLLNNVTIENCFIENLDNTDDTVNVAGIYCDRQCYVTKINGNTIKNIYRTRSDIGNIGSSGISIFNIINVCDITNNYIDGVYYPSGETSDADGIKVYSLNRLESLYDEDTVINISNNVIYNCQVRFIKVQGEHCNILNNTMRNRGIEIFTDYRAVDLQTGRGLISGNTIQIQSITGGTSMGFIQITGRTYTKNVIEASVINNTFINDVKRGYGVIYNRVDKLTSLHVAENNIIGVVNGVYIGGADALTNEVSVIVCENAFIDITQAFRIVTASPQIISIVENNYGAGVNKADIAYQAVSTNLIISSSITTVIDMMDAVWSDLPDETLNNIGNVFWQTHGHFLMTCTKYDADRGTLLMANGSDIYIAAHLSANNTTYSKWDRTGDIT